MSISWLTKLRETPDEKAERLEKEAIAERIANETSDQKAARLIIERKEQMDELKNTPEFRGAMVEAFNDLKQKELEDEVAKKKAYAEKVSQAKIDVELVGKTMQDSPEPFANVLAMGFTKENGIKVKIDFNPAFIRFLNSVGIKAIDDDETVRIWLAHLADDISREDLAQDYLLNGVDENEKPSMSYEEMFEMKPGDEDEDDENDNSGWEQPTA